jgi:hypothetical protein
MRVILYYLKNIKTLTRKSGTHKFVSIFSPVLDLLRLKPVTRFADASTRFGFRNPDFRPSANSLSHKGRGVSYT